jgi:high-affinity iron transporter
MRTHPRLLAALFLSCWGWTACTPAEQPADQAPRPSPATLAEGRRLFLQYCALCHGENGNGRGPRRAAFVRPPRDFTDAAWRDAASPRQVTTAIRDGVPGTAMASWAALGDGAIDALAAYVLSIGVRRK